MSTQKLAGRALLAYVKGAAFFSDNPLRQVKVPRADVERAAAICKAAEELMATVGRDYYLVKLTACALAVTAGKETP